MYCIKKITEDLTWVGANDRRLALFEGVYSVPDGVAYNSYLLTDKSTVLFDTVDKAVKQRFMENVLYVLGGRPLDYLVLQHIEPDHSAAVIELLILYPDMKVVCNAKALALLKQFHEFGFDIDARALVVNEGDTLNTGRHTLSFITAPMVHWPEVMTTYDDTDKILFSADAFGCFGALNGALFADEVDFGRDYMDEARRYYANIVGKYGQQVLALLGKAAAKEIKIICPLHGFVWRKDLTEILFRYRLWADYQPEERGVMIVYASVYGNTENAAEILACRLREKRIKTVMFDVSVTPASEIIAATFKWGHLVFASTTYNMGIFVTMEALLSDLAAHNIQNRTVALIENGSWAAASGSLMRERLAKCKNITILEKLVSIKSALKISQLAEIDAMADALASSVESQSVSAVNNTAIDSAAMFKLSYGLFVLTAREGDKDNGCIINTATQLTDAPKRLSIAVNKSGLTHDMILRTGICNISVLTTGAPFSVFQKFGFSSGRNTDKFAGGEIIRSANGLRYIVDNVNGIISGRVVAAYDYGTHTLFVADVTEAFTLSSEPSVTYQYYFDNIKPRPAAKPAQKKRWECKICGYIYEGGFLPEDYICPLCKHGAEYFVELK